MESHVDSGRLKEASERKIRLSEQEWQHIETCRSCVDKLASDLRQADGPRPPMPSAA